LKASKDKQQYEDNSNSNLSLSTLQEQQLIASEEPKPAINIGTPTSICNDSRSSNAGDGLKPEPDLKTSGGPLKFFLNPTAVAAVAAIVPTTEYNYSIPVNVNPIKEEEDILNSNLHSPAPALTLSIPPKVEAFPDRNLFIKDPETEMQVNIIESDTDVKYISKDQNVNSQNAAFEEELQPSLSDSEDPPVAVDWDSEENHQRRFWARVMDEKRERRQELQLIERRQQELD
jgi:hypothetical protein